MKNDGIAICFYVIAIFPNRIELLTCVRKHCESHATFALVFTEVDLSLYDPNYLSFTYSPHLNTL